MRGLTVFFPVDGTATQNENFHRATLLGLGHGFAVLASVKGRAFGSPLARGLYPRASTAEVDPLERFSPDKFLVKITPVNPTHQATANRISSHIIPGKDTYDVILTSHIF